jgi:hypothetical protein
MRFLYSVIILLFLFPNFIIGQTKKDHYIFHFGLRSVDIRSDNSLNTNFKPVVEVGLGINYQLSKNLQFQPELRYTPRGYRVKTNLSDSTSLTSSLSLHYLDLCPNFNYTFGNPDYSFAHLSVWGGPYLGIGIVGQSVTSGTVVNKATMRADSTFSRTNATFGNGLNRIDYGLNLGIGLQFDRMAQVGISYSMGFNNVSSFQVSPLYNQAWGLYVRVLFDDMF